MDSNAQDDVTPGSRLAHYAADFETRELPNEVLTKTRIHILDTLAAIASGSPLSAGRAGQRYVSMRSSEGLREASVVGTKLKVGVVEAALANGMSAHADESDDSHETSQTHPGCGVVPAALAVAEWVGASGLKFTKAVCLGYEVTIRFGEALVPCMSFARSSLSCHAFGPLFGAGFAVGFLLDFTGAQYLTLLNYLAQEASGLTTWRLDEAHTLKSYVFAGMPASNAVKVALMVSSGFTGAGDVLGLDRNFFDAISPGHKLQLDLSDTDKYRILETDLKKYSVGFPIAAPLAALESILAEAGPMGFTDKDIESVVVYYLDDWYKVVGDENKMPDLNLRHCLAATIVEGHLSFQASHDEARMQDPLIQSVGRKIRFQPAEHGQDRFEARIEMNTVEGKSYSARQGRNVLGRWQNPMSTEESDAKAAALLGTVMDRRSAENLIGIVHTLEKEKDLERPMKLLVGF